MLEWIVTSEESGLKLISFLSRRLEGKYSARYLKRAIEQNCCQINGRTERFSSTCLGKGDCVCFHFNESSVIPLQIEIPRILYEDESLFVYDKPAGINCDEKGILSLLRERDRSLHLVHRLDRDTTGVLILAKQESVVHLLIDQFKKFQVLKCYRAIVDRCMTKAAGKIENFLGKKQSYSGQTIWGAVNEGKGLYACTEWKRIKVGQGATLIDCYPKTGRTHQIRVHMSEMGYPLLGDYQYGKEFECLYRPPRYLLHSFEMNLNHPLTGTPLQFSAPLPDDFISAQQQLFSS